MADVEVVNNLIADRTQGYIHFLEHRIYTLKRMQEQEQKEKENQGGKTHGKSTTK